MRLELNARTPDVHADEAHLRQAVIAVLTNAQEALTDTSAIIIVRTGTRRLPRVSLDPPPVGVELSEGDFAFLEVEDPGAGMDENTQARMFDPFYSTKFLGRGLGLAAALGIVRIHGGAVDVRTRPDEGTRVTILLPIPHETPTCPV